MKKDIGMYIRVPKERKLRILLDEIFRHITGFSYEPMLYEDLEYICLDSPFRKNCAYFGWMPYRVGKTKKQTSEVWFKNNNYNKVTLHKFLEKIYG